MRSILAVVGARPQFIKHFAFERAVKEKGLEMISVHTGQHYDKAMSEVFFEEMGMQRPDYMLNLGGGSHGAQTGKMLIELERIFVNDRPSVVVVYGDTNSTLAGALAASKLNIPLVHIESGLRSFNRAMPEEINRILTDHMSDMLFTSSISAKQQLRSEGIESNVFVCGDIMKDTVLSFTCEKSKPMRLESNSYLYATMHRPYNVDNSERLIYILNSLENLDSRVLFSVHPRTLKVIKAAKIDINSYSNIEFIEPQSYLKNMERLQECIGLITDSGGMQKEAYWLKKKCATIRTETEWKETLLNGVNRLFYNDLSEINNYFKKSNMTFSNELYGDGKAAYHIVSLIKEQYLS